ncbi:FAD-dependent oxidoreductase [Algoriphagus sp. oki45]|uniref:NAD(P)/FAD-dependent oxidoreductase n=1 Tax=Algoriphagus sp. oki45 TaxID=3067294 RepID=UPI0027F4BB11|nr:FAD-dependent oxidoreductase [Algoriphagus sp. oki45]
MISYWEQKNFLNHDLIVVGSGFTGLSTAIHFKKKNPKAKVLVLEKEIFPTGASTKNAGFACFGSLTELLDDLQTLSEEEVLGLVKRRYRGLEEIRKVFGDKTLEYKANHGFEILDEKSEEALNDLEKVNRLLKTIFKKDVFSQVKRTKKLGFSSSVKAVVENRFEGELDPGKYLGALWKMASEMGVKILTGVAVIEVQKDTGLVLAENLDRSRIFEFQAQKVGICTNAFTKKLWPESEINPGRGLILLSQPIDGKIPWKGAYHMDRGYVYFRQIDGRLLLGGARNLDFEGETSTEFKVNPKIKSHLDALAKTVILPGKTFSWEMEWTGIMAFGSKKIPLIQKVGDRLGAAVRLGGMGVAIGWQVGKELSELLSGR